MRFEHLLQIMSNNKCQLLDCPLFLASLDALVHMGCSEFNAAASLIFSYALVFHFMPHSQPAFLPTADLLGEIAKNMLSFLPQKFELKLVKAYFKIVALKDFCNFLDLREIHF